MNYGPKDIFLERRTTNETFEEYPLHVQPNSVILSDASGNLEMVLTSSVTSSYAAFAVSASWAPFSDDPNAVSASWASQSHMADSASYAINADRAISASYAPQSGVITTAETASYILASGIDGVVTSASYAGTASYFQTSSVTNATSASMSNTSSYAFTAQVTDIGNPDEEFPIIFEGNSNNIVTNGGSTSLFSINPASGSIKASLFKGDLVGTASAANIAFNAISASWASSSLSASWAPLQISASYASVTSNVVGVLVTMAFASTTSINFNAGMFHSSSLSSSVYLTGSNLGVGKMASIKMAASGSLCNLYYPSQWVWLGPAPTAISASKTAVVSLTCYGSTDNDIVGAFATQV